MLANGSGGIDWAGLPIVVELLGVQELDPFIRMLTAIKNHRPEGD